MSLTRLVSIPATINASVGAARQQTMLSLIGNPRAVYTSQCQNPTDPHIAELMSTERVGHLRVTGLQPAVDSLREVLEEIQEQEPQIYEAMGHAGMLCARLVRGSQVAISNHSWGTAIDLTLGGELDRRGDGLVQEGLVRIAPIFNKHGWFWGAGFRTEDAMHFECSDQLIRQWAADGKFGARAAAASAGDALLSLGDRGPDVVALQRALNERGAHLLVDGDFGRNTLAAVMAFQSAQGLSADGVVGPKTRNALFG